MEENTNVFDQLISEKNSTTTFKFPLAKDDVEIFFAPESGNRLMVIANPEKITIWSKEKGEIDPYVYQGSDEVRIEGVLKIRIGDVLMAEGQPFAIRTLHSFLVPEKILQDGIRKVLITYIEFFGGQEWETEKEKFPVSAIHRFEIYSDKNLDQVYETFK